MPYLPKSKQQSGGQPEGNLIDPATGAKYLGKFVQDFLGNFFKGDKITSKSKPLELVPYSAELESGKYLNRLIMTYPEPSQADYDKGAMDRYFVKDARNGKIVELNKQRYSAIKKEEKTTFRVLKIEWYITGEAEDKIINGYLYPGTSSKNQDVINQAEKIIPGIGKQILKDPSQFVRK